MKMIKLTRANDNKAIWLRVESIQAIFDPAVFDSDTAHTEVQLTNYVVAATEDVEHVLELMGVKIEAV